MLARTRIAKAGMGQPKPRPCSRSRDHQPGSAKERVGAGTGGGFGFRRRGQGLGLWVTWGAAWRVGSAWFAGTAKKRNRHEARPSSPPRSRPQTEPKEPQTKTPSKVIAIIPKTPRMQDAAWSTDKCRKPRTEGEAIVVVGCGETWPEQQREGSAGGGGQAGSEGRGFGFRGGFEQGP